MFTSYLKYFLQNRIMWLALHKPAAAIRVCFTLAHTNACNFLTNLSIIYKCSVRNTVWSFGMYCGKICAVIGASLSEPQSVMVSYVACTDCENDKIRLTSHSGFVMVSYVACTDCENDKIRWTSYLTPVSYVACADCECWGVDEVREERLRRWRERGRREKEKLMNKDKQGL